MTVYVVDATVIAEFIVPGLRTQQAAAFLTSALTSDVCLVPELCLNECVNVIWKAVRFQGMPIPQGIQAVRDLKRLPLELVPTRSVLTKALMFGLTHELSIYDALYVALAVRYRAPLVTMDAKQAQKAKLETVAVIHISGSD